MLDFRRKGTREALKSARLEKAMQIGRGTFTAVYANSANSGTVKKVTICPHQVAFHIRAQDYPNHFLPRLVRLHGAIGKQDEHDILLYEAERLDPLYQRHPHFLTASALASQVLVSRWDQIEGREMMRAAGLNALVRLADEFDGYPELQDAMRFVRQFCEDTGAQPDFRLPNIMARGSQLVFNDVVAEIPSFY